MVEKGGKFRKYSGMMGIIVKAMGIALPVYALLFQVLNLPVRLGIYIHHESYNAFFLCLTLILVFLLIPPTKTASKRLPWYDILFILAGIVVTLYIAIRAPVIALGLSIWASPVEQILGLITFLLLCEAVRRTIGWPIVSVMFLFLFHAKFAYLFPGLLGGPKYSWARLGAYMYLYDTGIFGMISGSLFFWWNTI